MYAVLKSVGKQFKVSPGDVLKIDKIEGNVGDTISFKAVSYTHLTLPTNREV